MAERMDNRKVPECEKFDEEAGHDLEEFLDEFEDYCKENVKGDSKHWIKELENQLSGETLDAFKSFKEYKYHTISSEGSCFSSTMKWKKK